MREKHHSLVWYTLKSDILASKAEKARSEKIREVCGAVFFIFIFGEARNINLFCVTILPDGIYINKIILLFHAYFLVDSETGPQITQIFLLLPVFCDDVTTNLKRAGGLALNTTIPCAGGTYNVFRSLLR